MRIALSKGESYHADIYCSDSNSAKKDIKRKLHIHTSCRFLFEWQRKRRPRTSVGD